MKGSKSVHLPRGYDEWRLSPPETDAVGVEEGQPCCRFPEDDEDMGRARKVRCDGEMVDLDGVIHCDRCGAICD